jgi:CheY-like chemotaxis protein
MRAEILDDCDLPVLVGTAPLRLPKTYTVDQWFSLWARHYRIQMACDGVGALLIHAHAVVTEGGRRQDLQGIELLKHVRMTPWLRRLRSWHAIVYSFEPLEDILRRTPGNLILLSKGVTFLRLPDALDLTTALSRATPRLSARWRGLSPREVVDNLAHAIPATPDSVDFRPFVAADYVPPDSAHDVSNRWGIYDLYRAAVEIRGLAPSTGNYPEVDQRHVLGDPVREFVDSLLGKEARYLDNDAHTMSTLSPSDRATLETSVRALPDSTVGKTIAYIDDEASTGWADLLTDLLLDAPAATRRKARFVMPASVLGDYAKAFGPTHHDATDHVYCRKLTEWVAHERPDLVILDLRLLGSRERERPVHEASGMKVARSIRRAYPYLPILLFTASNKAETLAISRAFTVDDVWMKPGLGEHRPPGGGIAALTQLGTKVQRLLGRKYSWLRRAGDELAALEMSPSRALWWEKPFQWPMPERVGAHNQVGPADTYEPRLGLRAEVLALVNSILYLARAALRVEADWPTSAGPFDFESVSAPLRAAAFNRIGQVVERIHDADKVRVPGFATNGLGARVGGIRESKTSEDFLFRRCDWLAFRLVNFRNIASHPTSQQERRTRLSEESLRTAVCDLVAWLGTARAALAPINQAQARSIGAGQATLAKSERVGHALRMHPGDDVGQIAVDKLADCTPERAVLDGFRLQLAERSAFQPTVQKSDEISGVTSA